jgi:outer membrane protein assembly factor BamB
MGTGTKMHRLLGRLLAAHSRRWLKPTALLLTLFSYVGLQAPPAALAATSTTAQDVAVAYQVNTFHRGAQPYDALTPPLTRRWTMNFGAGVSYPLIANGKVFVTVANQGSSGTELYALNLATGTRAWGPIDLGGTYRWSNAAYENGRIFVVNDGGQLQAFASQDGGRLWTRQLPYQWSFSSPPTARNGIVYTAGAGSGGTLYAVAESSGQLLWTAQVMNGDNSSPVVTATGVYVSYACAQTYDFNPSTGALIWHHATACEGGGGKTPALFNGRLYVRDPATGNVILNAGNGQVVGTFTATPIPAFGGSLGYGYFLAGSTLRAESPSGAVIWKFSGDGTLRSAPLVSHGYVYVGSGLGHLYALSANTGHLVWKTLVGMSIPAPDEQNVSQPLTGFAVGGGYLIVPTSTSLIAYR